MIDKHDVSDVIDHAIQVFLEAMAILADSIQFHLSQAVTNVSAAIDHFSTSFGHISTSIERLSFDLKYWEFYIEALVAVNKLIDEEYERQRLEFYDRYPPVYVPRAARWNSNE